MTRKSTVTVGIAAWLAVLAGLAISAQDKYSAKVPGGLAMSNSRDAKDGRPSASAGTTG